MTARPVLDQLNLVVADMEAAVAFYRLLGIDVPDADPAWPDHHRTATTDSGVDLDFDTVEFATVWNSGWPGGSGGRTGVLGFHLATREEVDATYERLTAAGHPSQQPPYDAFWGSRFAVVEDPDGNAVGLMSPRDPAYQSAPPEMMTKSSE